MLTKSVGRAHNLIITPPHQVLDFQGRWNNDEPQAALFYSLIESAKLTGVEPAAYLREATRRAIDNPGTVTLPKELLANPYDTS